MLARSVYSLVRSDISAIATRLDSAAQLRISLLGQVDNSQYSPGPNSTQMITMMWRVLGNPQMVQQMQGAAPQPQRTGDAALLNVDWRALHRCVEWIAFAVKENLRQESEKSYG